MFRKNYFKIWEEKEQVLVSLKILEEKGQIWIVKTIMPNARPKK